MRQFSCRAVVHQFPLTLENGTKWIKIYETNLRSSHIADKSRTASELFYQVEWADVIKIEVEAMRSLYE
jgi:hypothetical protein